MSVQYLLTGQNKTICWHKVCVRLAARRAVGRYTLSTINLFLELIITADTVFSRQPTLHGAASTMAGAFSYSRLQSQ